MRKKYPERQIKNIIELTKIIGFLDLDEGIRILGFKEDFQGGGFIFISTVHSFIKSDHKYIINTTDRILNKESGIYLPGGKEEFLFTSDIKEVMEYIEKNALKPLKAWYY